MAQWQAALWLAVRRLAGGTVPASVIYHAVPSVLGANKRLAVLFQQAWNARVSPGELVIRGRRKAPPSSSPSAAATRSR